MAKPGIGDLEPEVADDISRWVDLVEVKEVFGLWIWGEPRIGTSYAGFAALTELGTRIEAYRGQMAYIRDAYAIYEDLKTIWSFGTPLNDATWAARDEIDGEQTALWAANEPLMLNDWKETVPVEFFMRHFYPLVRRRISAKKILIIATEFEPDVAGRQKQYFLEEFVIAHVTRRMDRDGAG